MNNDDNLDLLDLNDDDVDTGDSLPDAAPLTTPRARKPWLLMGVGVLIIILATYVIIRIVGGDSSSTMQVDLDAPAIIVDGADPNAPLVVGKPTSPSLDVAPNTVSVKPVTQPAVQPAQPVQPQVAQPQPVVEPVAQNTTPGVPVRVIEDRQEVTFKPDAKPVTSAKASKPANKSNTQRSVRTTNKQAQRTQNAPRAYAWYSQIGSYSTRALAESGQRQLQNSHKNLFSGHQFVILAAQLPNGSTTYRLRVGFGSSADANNFCRNAKADGLECYVTK